MIMLLFVIIPRNNIGMDNPQQGAFGKFPHGKRDGFSTMNIHTLEQFPPFEGNSYNFPTHKKELCQERML